MRILLVDDSQIVRQGIRTLLARCADLSVCGEASDGLEALEKAKQLLPDAILMDISMPRMDGLQATRAIRRDLPQAKVILVSQNDPALVRRQAAEVAAHGFVGKSKLTQDLIPAIQALREGSSPASASAAPPAPAAPARRKSRAASASSVSWLHGGGEMGRLVREKDWSSTPLGPPERWPQSLRTGVNLMLNSQHPIWIGWGPQMTFLYNDAYVSVLGRAKHPGSLGRPTPEVWSDIWDVCGPLAERVFSKGEPCFMDDVVLFMNRGDLLEEVYYSFSYSPIYDESGKVGGLFCPSAETTARVLHARRLRTLAELSSRSLLEKSPRAAAVSAVAALAINPEDVPFALLYLLDADSRIARLQGASGLPAEASRAIAPAEIELGAPPAPGSSDWRVASVVESSEPQIVSVAGFDGLPLGVAGQPLRQAIVLPVTSLGHNQPLGVLVCGVNPTRKLDDDYRTFFTLLADQVATALQNAGAAEEAKKRAEALAEIDRAKTAFFSNVSHEFRTPLTLMLGPLSDLLSRGQAHLSPVAAKQLELVSRNGSRLLRLVNTLLDFSRIEAGRTEAVYQATDLAAFTAELASVFRSATERAGLRLTVDCPGLGVPVYVDRDMWEKIVLNLISNAFKFTLEGEISVSVARAGDDAELRIRDTGIGISADAMPRLFERFHRIPNTRGRTFEGTGIGLALVQELVKLHGGSVRVESSPGQGSTFIVSLPLGQDHLPQGQIGGDPAISSTGATARPFVEEALRWLPDGESAVEDFPLPEEPLAAAPMLAIAGDAESASVIVADDNADMRQYLQHLLGEHYQVRAVGDGRAALAAARERPPDLVLSDAMMPVLDGLGLLSELRADARLRKIPLILLSARAGEENRLQGLSAGADDYLVKPFSSRELLARVEAHIKIHRMRLQAEHEQERVAREYEALLNSAPLGVFLVDANLRIRHVNPGALAMVGNIPDLIGRDFGEMLSLLYEQDVTEEMTGLLRRVLETGEPYVAPERALPRKDRGTVEYYEGRIDRVSLPDGQFGIVCYFRDISHQVRAREKVWESERRVRLATEAAELGIWYWYPGEDRATWENDRLYEILGRPRERGTANVAEFISRIIHPDDAGLFNSALQRALETGTRFFVQVRVFRSDGDIRWLEFTGQVQRNIDGSPLRMLGTVLDITDRKLSDEALRVHRERFDLVTQASQLGFWFCDLPFDKLIWDFRVKDHFWLPPDAVVTIDTFYERLHPDDREPTRKAIEESITKGLPYDVEYRTVSDDGRIKWIRAMGRAFYDTDGNAERFDGLTLDITERRLADERERQITADYRNLAESLEAEVQARTSELQKRNLDVLSQSETLRRFSQRLLQAQDEERRRIARELHDSSGQTLTALAINLSRILSQSPGNGLSRDVEESLQLVQQLSKEIRTTSYLLHPPLLDETGVTGALQWYVEGFNARSGIEMHLEIREDLGRFASELELAIFRIVQEALTNIHRHSGSKRGVIRLDRNDTHISLQIEDQGIGMSPEKLEEVRSGGAGVGLRGMRERIRQLRGEIVVRSDASGTSLHVTLPIRQPRPPGELSTFQIRDFLN